MEDIQKLDKAESSRRNGAKSNGPLSPETKAISSRNSLKFGFYAKRGTVLSTELQSDLDALRDRYIKEWLPQDQRQHDTVDKLVDAEWRYIRYTAMETYLVEDMMSQMRFDLEDKFDREIAMDLRAALAYDKLYKEGSTLQNLQRERQRLVRTIERLTRLLRDLQKDNPPAPAEQPHNEQEEKNSENEPEISPESPGSRPSIAAQDWTPAPQARRLPRIYAPEVARAVAG